MSSKERHWAEKQERQERQRQRDEERGQAKRAGHAAGNLRAFEAMVRGSKVWDGDLISSARALWGSVWDSMFGEYLAQYSRVQPDLVTVLREPLRQLSKLAFDACEAEYHWQQALAAGKSARIDPRHEIISTIISRLLFHEVTYVRAQQEIVSRYGDAPDTAPFSPDRNGTSITEIVASDRTSAWIFATALSESLAVTPFGELRFYQTKTKSAIVPMQSVYEAKPGVAYLVMRSQTAQAGRIPFGRITSIAAAAASTVRDGRLDPTHGLPSSRDIAWALGSVDRTSRVCNPAA
jgi:hypothetical protein